MTDTKGVVNHRYTKFPPTVDISEEAKIQNRRHNWHKRWYNAKKTSRTKHYLF